MSKSGRRRCRLLAALVVLLMSLLLLPNRSGVAQTPTPLTPTSAPMPLVQTARPADLNLLIQVVPNPLVPSRAAEITLRLMGAGTPSEECYGIPGQPVDMLIVVDNRPSAGSGNPGSNLALTRRILEDLITQSDQLVVVALSPLHAEEERSRIGLVTVSAAASVTETLRQPLTEDYQAVRQAVYEIPAGVSEGDLAESLRRAVAAIQQQGRTEARHVIVLALHEQTPITRAVVTAATEARQAGIDLFLISNSANIPPEMTIGLEAARTMVVDPAHFLPDPTSADLRRAFVHMSGGSEEWLARDIDVVVVWDPPGLEALHLSPEDFAIGGAVAWHIPYLAWQDEQTFRYQARVGTELGEAQAVSANASLSYVDCNGYVRRRLDWFPFAVEGPSITPTAGPLPAVTDSPASPTLPGTPGLPMVTPPPIVETPPLPPEIEEPRVGDQDDTLQPPWPSIPSPFEIVGWLSFLEPILGALPAILQWVLIALLIIVLILLLAFLIWHLIRWLKRRRRLPGSPPVTTPYQPSPQTTQRSVPRWITELTPERKVIPGQEEGDDRQ